MKIAEKNTKRRVSHKKTHKDTKRGIIYLALNTLPEVGSWQKNAPDGAKRFYLFAYCLLLIANSVLDRLLSSYLIRDKQNEKEPGEENIIAATPLIWWIIYLILNSPSICASGGQKPF
jgi:hypothetical protein